ncbi:UxaA family hydrolase [Lachnoclostridium sp. Marseille-P6806]|uniref:UxaA family hydrolase n=1 Tax=Lachnoclostridium sp. Marseille-P6806 TaxID=2364793 RepID=UPI00102FB1A2|nr:altronate dehydratase family protein [Lachnoclostridium sp. Marseille-P6806]
MKYIQIHPSDNVAVALEALPRDAVLNIRGERITARESIPQGHKIALTDIPAGGSIIKYGTPIASAVRLIPQGCHVHTHNAATLLSEQTDYRYVPQSFPLPTAKPQSFLGYRRKDGRTGIRNEIWIVPIVGCVNDTAKQLAAMNQSLVRGSIDGLYHWPHPFGCSQLGDDLEQTKRLLAALVRHPNAGAVLCLGLGCENLQMDMFREALGDFDPERVRFLLCQDVEDELEAGSVMLRELAAFAGRFRREVCPVSDLVVGMKCGGSDGLSGITANPAVGRFSDLLVAAGGSAILTEVPEMFGAENLLFARCADRDVFDRAVRMVNAFKSYFLSHGQAVYENPSPGNREGGITTLEDKSCGCIQKGGSAAIVDVLSYAEPVQKKGLQLLSGPGNDLVSATNLTAAGAQLILFTTGRGTPFGAPAPTVKISSNTALFECKRGWIDFNAGTIADGSETIEEAGERLLTQVLRIASGERTLSEIHGCREISIFKDGVVL